VSNDVTRGWHQGAAARDQALGPLTEVMLDLAGVTVDSRVLDIGAGTGEQTTLAAQRVGPGGWCDAVRPN
jgi:predicted methyltransferase